MLRAMGYTVYISTVSSILQIFVTCLAGYGFARFRFKGNAVLFVMVILTIIVPPQMLGMPNYLLMKNFDFFGLYGLLSGSPCPLHWGRGCAPGCSSWFFARCLPAFPMNWRKRHSSTAAGIGGPFSASCCPTR